MRVSARDRRSSPTRVDRLAHRGNARLRAVDEVVLAFGLREEHGDLLRNIVRGLSREVLTRALGAFTLDGLERSFVQRVGLSVWDVAEQIREDAR